MSKRIVLEYIQRVRDKALKSVNEKHDKIIQAKYEELMAGDAKPIFDMLESIGSAILHTSKMIDRINPDVLGRYGFPLHNLVIRDQETRELRLWDLKERICDFLFDNSDKVRNLKQAKQDEHYAVMGQYSNLYNTINRMKDTKKMVAYLEELGFDTTWIKANEVKQVEPTEKFDKKLLFVCGDNK